VSRAPCCKKCQQPMVEGYFRDGVWFCENEECAECDKAVYPVGAHEEEHE
jgi:hypothetical protein